MSLFQNPIIDAYKRQQISMTDSMLIESMDHMYGLDPILDEVIQEAVDRQSAEMILVISEELTDSEKYDADRMARQGYGGRSAYLESFLSKHPVADQAFRSSPEGRQRVRIPVTIKNQVQPHPDVSKHLADHGWNTDPDSYSSGKASKSMTVGNPEKGIPYTQKTVEKSIGSILSETGAHEHIKNAFQNDPNRQGAARTDYDIILSNHPHDVYGMQTGRGWTQCAQMRRREADGTINKGYDGIASRKMKDEIEHHTHVAYLVPRGGNVDKDAIGRLLFKKHRSATSSHETLIPESTLHGDCPHRTKQIMQDEVGKMFHVNQNEIYLKNPHVYDDSSKPIHVPNGAVPSKEEIDTIWSQTKATKEHAPLREAVTGLIQPGVAYKATRLRKMSLMYQGMHDSINKGDFVGAMDKLRAFDGEVGTNHNLHYRDTELSNITKKVEDIYDKRNPDHVNKVAMLKHSFGVSGAYHDTLRNVSHKSQHALIKTPQDMIDHTHYLNHIGSSRPAYESMSLADDHKFGSNVIKTAGIELGKHGLLNDANFNRAYLGLGRNSNRSGNYYDHVVGLTKHNVDGSDSLLNEVSAKVGREAESRIATIFNNSKPETRKIIADKIGVDHVTLMKRHKASLDRENVIKNALKAKRQEAAK